MITLATHLKSLAEETRFKILNLLLTHNLCVGALAHRLRVSKAAISQHLQVLRKAGLVKDEKRGYWTHYAVQRSVLKQIACALAEMANQATSKEGFCIRAFEKAIIDERRVKQMCKDCCE